MTPPPFVVFALPRSRTHWTSKFLSYNGWTCGHDEVRHCRTLDDIATWLRMPLTGTVETAAAPFWRLLARFGEVRVATVRRPVADVLASLQAAVPGWFDVPLLTSVITRLDRKLDQIERRLPGVLSVTFEELATEDGCARLFEHCLGLPHDPAWWSAVAPLNLQCDLPAMLRYMRAYEPQLAKLAKIAKHRITTTMATTPRREPDDGVTFQTEPFPQFYRDAEALFAEHLVQTEQAPDDHMRKNLPLFARLDELGALQVLTARSNGRMFGYLVSVVAPSLDSPHEVNAEHTIFFASPEIRNLGMRLQRAAVEALRARGVNHVLMRAGHRGSGPRLGTLYRRMGADEFGQLYRLSLGEA